MMSIGRSLAIVCAEAGPPRGIPGRVTQVPPGGLAGLPEDPRNASALEDQSAVEYPNCDLSELGRIAANQGKCGKAFYTDHSTALILCLTHESNAYCVVCDGIFVKKPKAFSSPSPSSPPRFRRHTRREGGRRGGGRGHPDNSSRVATSTDWF